MTDLTPTRPKWAGPWRLTRDRKRWMRESWLFVPCPPMFAEQQGIEPNVMIRWTTKVHVGPKAENNIANHAGWNP